MMFPFFSVSACVFTYLFDIDGQIGFIGRIRFQDLSQYRKNDKLFSEKQVQEGFNEWLILVNFEVMVFNISPYLQV